MAKRTLRKLTMVRYDKVMKEREEFLAEHRRRELQAKREANKKRRLDEAALVIQRTWKVVTLPFIFPCFYSSSPS
jgi:hypothetical protein